MQTWTNSNLPQEEFNRLSFLVGDYTSGQTLWPAGAKSPIRFRSILSAHREGCDRFVRVERFADIPELGIVSSNFLYTFNRRDATYDSFGFCSAYEEAMRFKGTWQNGVLVLVSEPIRGYSGLERFRQTLTPRTPKSWEFLEERWEPEGYVQHVRGIYRVEA